MNYYKRDSDEGTWYSKNPANSPIPRKVRPHKYKYCKLLKHFYNNDTYVYCINAAGRAIFNHFLSIALHHNLSVGVHKSTHKNANAIYKYN